MANGRPNQQQTALSQLGACECLNQGKLVSMARQRVFVLKTIEVQVLETVGSSPYPRIKRKNSEGGFQ